MEEIPCHCNRSNKECDAVIATKSSETSSSKKSIKGRHTLLKSEHSCNCYATHNEDIISYYMRQLQEVEQSLCNKNLMIAMLQEQLKKFEKLYKKNIDETQNIRYKYCYASRELSNLKKIFQKYEEENKKLLEDKENNENKYNEKEIEELQNEANKWKQLYEEVLNKIQLMEEDMNKMKELLATKEEALVETETKTNNRPVNEVLCEDLKEQYGNIENALVLQNEKLDMIYKILNSDLKKQSGEIQSILSATQGDIIEISIEAKKLRKVTASLQEISVEKLWSENTALKKEIEKIKSTSTSCMDKHKGCCSMNSYNLLLNDLNMCRNNMKNLQTERDELKLHLEDYETIKEENAKLKNSLQGQQFYSYSNACTQTETKKIQSAHTITDITGNDQENKINELQIKNNQQRNEIEKLFNENSKIAAHEKKLKEVVGLYEDLQKQYTELLNNAKQFDLQLKNLISETKQKEAEIESLKVDIEELEEQLHMCILKSNKSLVLIDDYENKILKLEEGLNQWKTKCHELHEKVTVLEENEYKLKKELITLEVNLNQANSSLEKYEGQLKNKEDETEKLRKLSKDLELTIQNLNEDHEKAKRELQNENEINKLALAEVAAEHENLKTTMNNYEGTTSKKIEELLKELEKLTDETTVLKNLVVDLTSQVCHRQSVSKYDNDKIVSLEEECSVLKERNRLLEKEAEEKAELEAILSAIENKLIFAEKEIREKDIQLQEKSDDLKTLQEKQNGHMEKVKELDYLVRELTDENDNLKSNLDNLVKSLENKINEVNLCNDFKECQCSSSLEIELQHKATQTVKNEINEKATGCKSFPENSSTVYKPTYSFSPCISYYRRQREFDSEELEIKRRYLINRILSIDTKLNLLQESAIHVTSSKSLPHLTPECSCSSKQSHQKKIVTDGNSKHKKEGVLTLFEKNNKKDVNKSKKPTCWSCSCSSTDLIEENKRSDNSKIVANMRKELEEVSCSLAMSNIESSSKCICLAERVVDLQDQIYTTSKIEQEVELLEKHLHQQRNQALNSMASYISRPCVNPDCLEELEKRQILLKEIGQIEKKLKNKKEEEHLLRLQCKAIADGLEKAEVVTEKSDDDFSNIFDTDDSFPQQPLIKIKCSGRNEAECSKLPSPLLISTVQNCKKCNKKENRK